MVGVVLLVRYDRRRAQDLLEALDPQGFVQVPVILFF